MRPKETVRRFTTAALLALGVLSLGGGAHAEMTGRVDLFAGQRELDSSFEPAEDATELGLAVSIGREGWPVRIAFDLLRADEDATAATTLSGLPVTGRAEVEINEVALGVRRIVGDGRWRWHYGGGIALVDVEVESTITDASGPLFASEQDDDAFGPWLAVGGVWELSDTFDVGALIRFTDAEVDLGGSDDFDTGGVRYGLTLGYRW